MHRIVEVQEGRARCRGCQRREAAEGMWARVAAGLSRGSERVRVRRRRVERGRVVRLVGGLGKESVLGRKHRMEGIVAVVGAVVVGSPEEEEWNSYPGLEGTALGLLGVERGIDVEEGIGFAGHSAVAGHLHLRNSLVLTLYLIFGSFLRWMKR